MQMAFGKNGEVIPNVRGSCVNTSPAQLGAVTSPRIGLELGPCTCQGRACVSVEA